MHAAASAVHVQLHRKLPPARGFSLSMADNKVEKDWPK